MAATALSCATNPVTGERQLSLISESQEIAIGREAAQEVESSIGLVQEPSLQQYVEQVGLTLAKASERPSLPWHFGVVDDPTPNAFALPGGFVYVTRGLMNLMDSEAELASVLGHEIGHVTARHSVSMISRQQIAQLGLGLGGVLFPELQPAAQALGAGLGLLFLRYGRDAERQADELGFDYAHAHGYDMSEMADVFTALERAAELEHQSPLPTWLASHPAPAERVEAVRARIAALPPENNRRVDRAEYLGHIDGLVFGVNPRNGFFRDQVFYHPDLRFKFAPPAGWETANLAQAVVASSHDGRALLQLTMTRAASATSAAQQFVNQSGVQPVRSDQPSINGIRSAIVQFRASADNGVPVDGYAAFFDYRGRVYQLLGYEASSATAGHDAEITRAIASFAPVTDRSVLTVAPERIDIVRLDQPQTLARFNQVRPSTVPLPRLALVNQVTQPSATMLPSGTLVKRVVRQSGSPSGR